MLLDQLERIQIADPLIERGRSPDVREQERDVADREALGAAHHLGPEQAPERLAGEQVLAGEVGIEVQQRVVLAWGGLENGENAAASTVGFSTSSATGPGASVGLVRLVTGAEIGQAQRLRLGAGSVPTCSTKPASVSELIPDERARRRLEREAWWSRSGSRKRNPAQRRADRVDDRAGRPAGAPRAPP